MLLVQIFIGSLMVIGTAILHVFGVVKIGLHLRRRYPDFMTRIETAQSVGILTTVTLGLFLLHTIEIWAWAALYMLVGEFTELAPALYFSTVTFTTLGYGDVTLSADWQVLSGIEAANGILLFGVSTAVLLSAFRRIIQDSLSKDREHGS